MLQNLFYDYILLERGLSQNSLDAYKRDVEAFLKHFGSFVVSEEEVREYFYNMSLAKSTISRKISVIKSLYKFLVTNRYVEFSPVDNLVGLKRATSLPKHLSSEEIKKLANSFDRDYLGVRDKLIFDLLIYTGARVSEVLDLEVSAISFEDQHIRFLGKGQKMRIVPIHSFLLESIDRYIKEFRPIFNKGRSPKLFLGMSRNNFWYRIKRQADRIGIEVHPHIFRHSFATIMLGNGADIRFVQEMLGHSSVSTTEIYTHVSKKHLKDAHNKIFRREDE